HIVRGRVQNAENRPERVFNRLDSNDDLLITQDEVSENLWTRLGQADTDDVEGVSLAELLDLLESREHHRPNGPRPGHDDGTDNVADGDAADA
ncbi:MAG: hypothetical protein ACI9HK_003536, partial [Pirellulaceae bacterium]